MSPDGSRRVFGLGCIGRWPPSQALRLSGIVALSASLPLRVSSGLRPDSLTPAGANRLARNDTAGTLRPSGSPPRLVRHWQASHSSPPPPPAGPPRHNARTLRHPPAPRRAQPPGRCPLPGSLCGLHRCRDCRRLNARRNVLEGTRATLGPEHRQAGSARPPRDPLGRRAVVSSPAAFAIAVDDLRKRGRRRARRLLLVRSGSELAPTETTASRALRERRRAFGPRTGRGETPALAMGGVGEPKRR